MSFKGYHRSIAITVTGTDYKATANWNTPNNDNNEKKKRKTNQWSIVLLCPQCTTMRCNLFDDIRYYNALCIGRLQSIQYM